MTQYDEQEKTESAGPSSKPATSSQAAKSTNPIINPMQQPAWTKGIGGPLALSKPTIFLDPNTTLKILEEERKPVSQWLDANTDTLHFLSLKDLVRRVRKNVPEATKLADVEIQQVIHLWAEKHSIVIPALSAFPGPDTAGDTTQSIATASDSDFIASVSNAFSKIPKEIKVKRSYGQVVVDTSGASTEMGTRGRFGLSMNWKGKVGLKATSGPITLSGDIDKDQWNIKFAFLLGASAPDISGLHKIFDEAGRSIDTIVDETSAKGINGAKAAIEAQKDKLEKAINAATQIAKVKTGKVSVGAEASAKGPTHAGEPPTAGGYEVKILVTYTF